MMYTKRRRAKLKMACALSLSLSSTVRRPSPHFDLVLYSIQSCRISSLKDQQPKIGWGKNPIQWLSCIASIVPFSSPMPHTTTPERDW